MVDANVTETVPDATTATEEDAPHRRGGRRLLVLAGAGLLVAGAVWSFTTIRAGLAGADKARGRKGKRRR